MLNKHDIVLTQQTDTFIDTMAERALLVEEIAGTWIEPVAVAVGMRTCDCKPVKPVEGVGRRGGGFLVTGESPMVMIL